MSGLFELCIVEASVILRLFEDLNIPVQEASLISPLKGNISLSSPIEVEQFLLANALWENDAPSDEVRRALRALGMPRKQYEIHLKKPDKELRLYAFSNGKDVVTATFGSEEEVGFSRPLTFPQFMVEMIKQVGAAPGSDEELQILRLNPPTFSLICKLIELGLDRVSLPFAGLGQALTPVFPQEDKARLFLDALIEDRVLIKSDNGYAFDPEFSGWVQALRSGHHMQIRRKDLIGGRVPEKNQDETVVFFGPPGERYSMLEAEDNSGDLHLCRPGAKHLRALMGGLLGELNSPKLALHIPISPR